MCMKTLQYAKTIVAISGFVVVTILVFSAFRFSILVGFTLIGLYQTCIWTVELIELAWRHRKQFNSCLLFGHIWNGWSKQTGAFSYGDEYRECLLCKRYESRFTALTRAFGLGSPVYIRLPQKWTVRDSLTHIDGAS